MASILPFLKVGLIAWSCKQNTLSTIWCLLCVWLSFCRCLCCEANTDEPFQDRTMCDMMVFMANGDIGWYEIVVTYGSIVIIIVRWFCGTLLVIIVMVIMIIVLSIDHDFCDDNDQNDKKVWWMRSSLGLEMARGEDERWERLASLDTSRIIIIININIIITITIIITMIIKNGSVQMNPTHLIDVARVCDMQSHWSEHHTPLIMMTMMVRMMITIVSSLSTVGALADSGVGSQVPLSLGFNWVKLFSNTTIYTKSRILIFVSKNIDYCA